MRILLALAILLTGCSKKKDDAPAPATTETKPAAKPEEAKPAPAPVDDEKPTPTEPDKPTPTDPAKPTPAEPAKPATMEPAKPAPPVADKRAPVAGAPTKQAAIQHLRDVLAALEAKDWNKAVTYFAFPANERPRGAEAAFGKLIELKEISAKGIDVLAAKGKWGKLVEVFEPEKAAHFADKFKVPLADCYGFSVESATANASVGFYWDGKELKLIRLNNVGKLE
ncbi:MAG: hypothetical protein M4D80_26300 [Myxococcota bacterium]|nr:hypothetical protein [Deltaproteobacteria bacterium]MDQ3338692.1 hypothetical protein [Myxococcota bacterium]